MHSIICGNGGSLGEGFMKHLNAAPSVLGHSASHFEGSMQAVWTDRGKTVAVHCAKDDSNLQDLADFCSRVQIPLIQASTGQKRPERINVPFVEAPNLALPIIICLKAFPELWKAFGPIQSDLSVTVVESHQSWKKSLAGTAVKFAEAFGVLKDAIISERRPAVQAQLGVRDVSRHGYHWIRISGMGAEIGLTTKVDGLDAYAQGLMHVGPKILEAKLSPGIYPVTDFI